MPKSHLLRVVAAFAITAQLAVSSHADNCRCSTSIDKTWATCMSTGADRLRYNAATGAANTVELDCTDRIGNATIACPAGSNPVLQCSYAGTGSTPHPVPSSCSGDLAELTCST